MRVIWGLLAVALIATMGWGGYWFVGARALERAVTRTLDGNPMLSATSHALNGFPNRFDLTLTEPRLEHDGLRWRSPFVQFFALSYRPNHVIAVFAHDQQFTAQGRDFALHTSDMRASLVMEPGLSLPLTRLALVAEAPVLSADGQTHRADAARFASRVIGEQQHEAVIELESAFPDAALMDVLDPEGHWPRRFDVIRLDGEARLDRPLDRHALDGVPPQVVALALTGGRLVFEGVSLTAAGRLEVDARGLLTGDVTLTVIGFRALMQRARDAGYMPAEHDFLMTLALQSMTDPSNPERLDAPFTLREGVVMLGPVALWTIPPLF